MTYLNLKKRNKHIKSFAKNNDDSFFLNQLRLTRMRYIILTHNRIWRWCLPILHTQVVVQWSYIYHRKEQHVHWQMRTCFQIHLPAMTRLWSHKLHMFMTQSKNFPKLNNYDAQHVRKMFVLWETGMLYIIFKQVFFSPVTCFLLSFSLDFFIRKQFDGNRKARPKFSLYYLQEVTNDLTEPLIFFPIKRICISQPFN